MKRVLKYLELKSGYSDDGPAWIARVGVSKSGRTVYFQGKALKRGQGIAGNHIDLVTFEEWWVSGVKKDGTDRHWAGSGKVSIEAGVVQEYLSAVLAETLDQSLFEIVPDFEATNPAAFYHLENQPL